MAPAVTALPAVFVAATYRLAPKHRWPASFDDVCTALRTVYQGDVNLTFKRYIDSAVTLQIENDFIVAIKGRGTDADLMRAYYESWSDPNAYAVSHVGWGMAAAARWDALAMYNKRDTNGTELRAFGGNFLFSTGANETANRFTACHFDYPMRHCTVRLDDQTVVDNGTLAGDLA